ncbi:hypothetical protein EDD11_010566 [Mortierella claussenii]|nr:hypothetical protein EDD11_010566 [Mortierella claussenii]
MESDIPAIDAIFLVRFDTRMGNVLEWSDAVPGIELQDVEFSALPSGLHSSSQDVIYFQLKGCIGVSVFANAPSLRTEHRGAHMISVGVLVKPSADTGRCGQVWRHVDFLKGQARLHAIEDPDIADLASYFARHKAPYHVAGPSSTSKRDSYRARNIRRISRSFTLSEPLQPFSSSSNGHNDPERAEEIPPSHPSHHFLRLVQAMGPSVYILWKAALLRKRILIYTPTPVEPACLFVYNICLMATVPPGVTSLSQTKSSERTLPLFCVGIHDIDNMQAMRAGYVACTTDKLLMFKPELFDVLVDLSAPPAKSTHPRMHVVKEASKEYLQEESRPNAMDSRRYFLLLQQLGRFRRRQEWMQRRLYTEASSSAAIDISEESEGLRESSVQVINSEGYIPSDGFNMSDTLRKMLTGGWWWWYGGEGEDEEDVEPLISTPAAQDHERDFQDMSRSRSGACLQVLQLQSARSSDTEAIRFFHNLTSTLLSDLGRLISYKATAAIFEDSEDASSSLDENGFFRLVEISKQDVRQLGLDPCKDGEFVQELARHYFGSNVRLQRSELDIWSYSTAAAPA